jgi:hypothetical protein
MVSSRRWPRLNSARTRSTSGTSIGPRKVSEPMSAGSGRAPTAMTRWS